MEKKSEDSVVSPKGGEEPVENVMGQFTADETQSYLAAIIESSDDAIISKDLNGIIRSWNNAAERIFGYTAEEMVGQPVLKLIPEYLHYEENEILEKLRHGERIDHYETKRMAKDGRLIDISLTVSPVKNTAGQIIGASKIARDITLQNRAKAERDSLLQQLQEADRRKDEFLATLSHELRNPLAPISNAIEIMQLTDDEDIREESVEIIERQQRQLTRLVDDLLDVSRITRGKLKFSLKPALLKEAIASAIETIRPLIDARHHKLSLDLPEDPVWINGDPVRLSQIFSNLLNNAAKYTNPGGQIEVIAFVEDQEAVICIKDNGIGIEKEKLGNIFDMFMQAESSFEKSHGGLGIGLTLVNKLTELHGGSVQAFSEGPGKGSEFTVKIPLATRTHTDSLTNETAEPEKKGQPSYRILVVDDNEAVVRTTARVMELLGHEVRTAGDGIQALETGKAFRPHVVLLDIGLPGENGYDICQKMRGEDAFAGTTIIAQTGWGQQEYQDRSREAGFDYHLVKPIRMKDLEEILQDLPEPDH